jgi:hypothetical protein
MINKSPLVHINTLISRYRYLFKKAKDRVKLTKQTLAWESKLNVEEEAGVKSPWSSVDAGGGGSRGVEGWRSEPSAAVEGSVSDAASFPGSACTGNVSKPKIQN